MSCSDLKPALGAGILHVILSYILEHFPKACTLILFYANLTKVL